MFIKIKGTIKNDKKILPIILISNLIYADFIRDDEKNIVIDTATLLIWQDELYTIGEKDSLSANTESGKALHWVNAINYCDNLMLGGYSDWKLPNINELYTITNKTIFSKFDIAFLGFSNSYYTPFWSSTTCKTNSIEAYTLYNNRKQKDKTAYVKCVRLNN